MRMPAFASPSPETEKLSDRFFALLVTEDLTGAVQFARAASADISAEAVVLDVIAPAQIRAGKLWHANSWAVAKERATTHISERALAAVIQDTLAEGGGPRRGCLVVACVDGEWHALPAELVADVLRLRGWEVSYLGTSVSECQLITYLQDRNPEAVALSCTLQSRLPKAHRMIEATHRLGLPVLVGGHGFGPDGKVAELLGADAWAGDAREAAAVLDKGLARRDITSPGSVGRGVTACAEYAGLLRHRKNLVNAGLRRSMELLPGGGARVSPEMRDRTVENLGYLTDFLAASVYMNDHHMFVRYLRWLREALESRSVPFWIVLDVLKTFETLLGDSPTARTILHQSRAALAG